MERLTGRFKDGGAFILPSVVSQLSPMKSEIIEKLADYEDAEEQGLLLRLPCKEGTGVFCIDSCAEICNDADLPWECPGNCQHKVVVSMDFDRNMIEHIGKTVFLTIEEAEKALADMGV